MRGRQQSLEDKLALQGINFRKMLAQYIKMGKCCVEIATIFGATTSTIREYAKIYGLKINHQPKVKRTWKYL
jgi:hypothetical protein